MNPQPQSQLFQDTFLGSKYLNPEYLFSWGVDFFGDVLRIIVGDTGKTVMAVLSIFFVTIILYSFVRLLEIRIKEHRHLEHEIAEHARRSAEREARMREEEGVSKN